MPDKQTSGQPSSGAMGDIIGATRQRIETKPADPAARLKSLVAATSPMPPAPHQPPHQPAPQDVPPGYFPQISAEASITPKRPPKRGPTRSLHISMRLAPHERDRLVQWCDARNLSLADGVMALLEQADAGGEQG